MAVSHQPSPALPERRSWSLRDLGTEVWASLAISVIWLAVLFTAVYGGDIVTINAGGGSSKVPSGVVVALFAFLATWAVARYGFGRRHKDAD
jgi:uncharacterized RDD family membrane protein YckC